MHLIAPIPDLDMSEVRKVKTGLEESFKKSCDPDDYIFIQKVIRSQLFYFFLENDR